MQIRRRYSLASTRSRSSSPSPTSGRRSSPPCGRASRGSRMSTNAAASDRGSSKSSRKHTSSVRCVIPLCFLHLTGWTVDRKITSIRPASRRAACLSCVTTLLLYKELYQLFYAEVPVYTPEKGKSSAVLFVGQGDLQESTSIKYAYYQKLRGYNTSIVCALRLRYDAHMKFQTRSKKAGVPFSGSYASRDGAVAARSGLSDFRKAKSDIIVVVARDEMVQVAEETNPDLVVLTIDASIGGQAVYEQANIFKAKYPSGAVILSSMISRTNAAGAISSVAAAKLPLLYVETGDSDDGLEMFDSKSFVTKLLGLKNTTIEINTKDFHDLLLDCEASQAEEIALIENLKNAYMEQQTQLLGHYTLLRDKILALGAEYSDLCDLLGQLKAKTTKIKANSLQDRHDCIVNRLKDLSDTKKERMQKLRALQCRAQALCRFLGVTVEEHQYQFLSDESPVQVDEVVNVNGLSEKFLVMVQKKVNDMEDVKSRTLANIFGKMYQLDKFLQQESHLKGHQDYQLDFTRDAVEKGTVGWQTALKSVEGLMEKATDAMLIRKLISHQARILIEDQNVISQARLDDIRGMLQRIDSWQLKYNVDLFYLDAANERVSFRTELKNLEVAVQLKLGIMVAPSSGIDSGDEMAVSPERTGEHGGNDTNMSPNASSPEGSSSLPIELDDEDKDPTYSPKETDGVMRD
ncbi:hypothetical protein ACQJBY_049784 [Aegilops geniculata]